jgi:hypothetical protein
MSMRIINIRVTPNQYDRIQLKKEALGYATLSQLLRDLLLKENLHTEKMIREIHKAVVKEMPVQ